MNIIKDQREDVIRENNTGQKYVKNFLENLTRRTEVLDIREPLHGDLDFAILRNNGFMFVHTILLVEGEITSIRNVPETVHTLKCPKNLLFSIENLPSSLIHLEIPYNYLTNFDFSNTGDLQYINVSNNNIVNLENFSPELTEIYLQQNKLTHLDLRGLPKLKSLNISNNNITIIENLPENIIDFVMENTPSIEFRNSPIIPEINKDKTEEESIQQNINYVEAIHEYFRLKAQYETSVYKLKKTAYQSVKSKKEGKKRAQAVKPKCINCKRPVGTIFSTKDERCIAVCGDSVQPCKLNIELYKGTWESNQSLIYDLLLNMFDRLLDVISN